VAAGVPDAYRMPAFREQLSDQEIAEVLSFVRSTWGNQGGAVDAQAVGKLRGHTDPASSSPIILHMRCAATCLKPRVRLRTPWKASTCWSCAPPTTGSRPAPRTARHCRPHLGLVAAPGGLDDGLARDGRVVGSVSGGCIEDDLILRYTSAHGGGPPAPQVVRYGISADEAHRFGLPCGGTLELILEFNPEPQLLQRC
jgi:hypothetical protein